MASKPRAEKTTNASACSGIVGKTTQQPAILVLEDIVPDDLERDDHVHYGDGCCDDEVEIDNTAEDAFDEVFGAEWNERMGMASNVPEVPVDTVKRTTKRAKPYARLTSGDDFGIEDDADDVSEGSSPSIGSDIEEIPRREEMPLVEVEDRVPRVFKTSINWPKKSKLWCWNCGLPCDSYTNLVRKMPRFIPDGFISDDYSTIGVKGIACTFSCALRYINDNTRDKHKIVELTRLLEISYLRMMGEIGHISTQSPPRHRLVMYGGDMSIPVYMKAVEDAEKSIITKPRYVMAAPMANAPLRMSKDTVWNMLSVGQKIRDLEDEDEE